MFTNKQKKTAYSCKKKTGHLPIPMKKHYQIELYIYRSCLQINLILAMTSQSQQVATIETEMRLDMSLSS